MGYECEVCGRHDEVLHRNGPSGLWRCLPHLDQQWLPKHKLRPDFDEASVTLFECAPRCEHNFKDWENFSDGSGGSLMCSKCGRSAMEIDQWEGP